MPNTDDNFSDYAPADDALSLLTGTEGSEGDFARNITAEGAKAGMLADAAKSEQQVSRTPIAATTTTDVSQTVTTDKPETNSLSDDATRVRASTGSLADAINTTTATDAAKAVTTDAPKTGAENNATTTYDPNQKIILGDGTETTLAALEHGAMLKPRYDAKVTELQKMQKDLDAKKAVVDSNMDYINATANNPASLVLATALKAGATTEAALRSAAEAVGINLGTAKADEGPPQPGSEKYYLTPYDQLGIEPGTVDYDKWFSGNIEAKTRVVVREERAEMMKTINSTLDSKLSGLKTPAAETEEQTRDKEVRGKQYADNMGVLATATKLVLDEHKIDLTSLSQEDRNKVALAVTERLAGKKLFVDDKEWMETNPLTENDIENAVLRTPIRQILSQKGAVVSGQTQQQIVRPQIEKSLSTIAPLPASDGSVPEAPVYARDEAHQYVTDALDMLHAE